MPLTESYVPADTSSPVLETTVGGILREAAAKAPDTVALIEGVPGERRTWTYAELLTDAERVARALAARFEKGDRVAVWAPNIPEWVLLEYGAGLAGVVLVTVNPAYQPKELEYVLRQSRSSGIFYLRSFRGIPSTPSSLSTREGSQRKRASHRLALHQTSVPSVYPRFLRGE